jgi:hypothetical protein
MCEQIKYRGEKSSKTKGRNTLRRRQGYQNPIVRGRIVIVGRMHPSALSFCDGQKHIPSQRENQKCNVKKRKEKKRKEKKRIQTKFYFH